MPAAPGALGYPTQPFMIPPGYTMPAGYAMPPGMMMPQGYFPMPPGYGVMPGYLIPPAAVPAAPITPAVALPVISAKTPVVAPAKNSTPVEIVAVAALPFIPPSSVTHRPVRQRSRFVQMWQKIGGGSLMLSILIHGGILMVAGLIVFTAALQDKAVDFLPGGGTQQGAEANAALSHKIQQKKRQQLNKSTPRQRLVSTSLDASVSLPDTPADVLDVPDVSSMIGSGGKLGGAGGFGSGGAGGGFGSGLDTGALSGITFKPLMMFGVSLKDTRKIAVVMDVSRSMTKYLPLVAKELDKVAYGSPLVLYFGCGLKTPPSELEDKVRKVGDERFDKFWQYWEGKGDMAELRQDYDKLKYNAKEPMPLDAIYQQMKKRPNTYFIDFNGIAYTSTALICKEVMEADTLYWFSDFQDAVDESQVKTVMKKLRGRKQKLYIHASVRGTSFEIIRDELVKPLGGEVIETKAE